MRAGKLTEEETASFLAHCLHINRKYLDPEFVHYVHRVSAGETPALAFVLVSREAHIPPRFALQAVRCFPIAIRRG